MEPWVTVFFVKHAVRQNTETCMIRLVRQPDKCRNVIQYKTDPSDLEALQEHMDRLDVFHVEELLDVVQDCFVNSHAPTDVSVGRQRNNGLLAEVDNVWSGNQPIRGEVRHFHDVVEVFDGVSELHQQPFWEPGLLKFANEFFVERLEGFGNVLSGNITVDIVKAILLDSTLLEIW